MPEHPNVEIVRRGYEAFASGDQAALAELIAEDAVWHVGGRNLFTDSYRGRDAIFGYFRKLEEFTNGTFAIELHDVLANDEHAVALGRLTAERARNQLAMNACISFHLRDGRVVESWTFPEDQYAADEFFTYRKHSQGRMP